MVKLRIRNRVAELVAHQAECKRLEERIAQLAAVNAQLRTEIAARKQMEEALRESEESLRAFMESSTTAFSIFDSQLNLINVNDRGLSFFQAGTQKDEILGKNLRELVPDVEETGRYDRYMEVIKTGTSFHVDDIIPHPKFGEKRISITAFKTGEGLGLIVDDITERKLAEQEVQDWKHRYEAAILASGHLLYDWDSITNDVNYGGNIEKFLGYGMEEMVSAGLSGWVNIIHPEDKDYFNQAIEHLIETKGHANLEYRIRRNDGEYIIVEDDGYFIADAEGNPTRMVGFVKDITDRKLTEEVLKESEQRYRRLFENAVVGFGITNESGQIIDANEAMERITGYSREEMAHLRLPDTYANLEERGEILKILRSDGKAENVEVQLLKKSGEAYWVSLSMRVIEYRGEPAVFTAAIDITERKQADEQLETSLKEKEVLLQEIHHRVKNNLQTIVSLLNLQSQRVQDKNIRELFEDSQARVRTMALVHEQLYQSNDPERVNCAVFLRQVATHILHSNRIDSSLISLKMEAKDVSLDTKKAISAGLIVNELISNSLKYAFPEGRKGEIKILIDCSDGTLTLIVGDDGIGFPEYLDFQDSPSLGLRLVSILTQQLEGTIELDRTNGTEFRITFAC